jgi:hypothetical protein
MIEYALTATSLVRTGWSWATSRIQTSPDAANEAKLEAQRKKQAADRCAHLIMNANARLKGLDKKENQMVSI